MKNTWRCSTGKGPCCMSSTSSCAWGIFCCSMDDGWWMLDANVLSWASSLSSSFRLFYGFQNPGGEERRQKFQIILQTCVVSLAGSKIQSRQAAGTWIDRLTHYLSPQNAAQVSGKSPCLSWPIPFHII